MTKRHFIDGLWLALCAAVVLLLDAALASDWPVHVDTVNLGLGAIRGFDPLHYQPHPPGYLGYVLYLDFLNLLGFGAGEAVPLARWGARIAAAGVPVVAGLLARQVWQDSKALRIAALLAATNPLLLTYAMDGQTYPAEAIALGAGLAACFYVLRRPDLLACVVLGLVVGALGALRPTITVFLGLPSLFVLIRVRRDIGLKGWLASIGAGAAALLAWFLPTILTVGGFDAWRELTGALVNDTIAAAYSPLSAVSDPRSLVQNTVILIVGLAFVTAPALLGLVGSLGTTKNDDRGQKEAGRNLLWLGAALVVPSALLYVLLFCAEPGYLLGQLPLWTTVGAGLLLRRSSEPRALALAAVGALLQVVVFLGLPGQIRHGAENVQLSPLPSAASISLRQRQAAAWTKDATAGLPPGDRQLVLSDYPADTWTKNLPLVSPDSSVLLVHLGGRYVMFRWDTMTFYHDGPLRWAPGPVPLADGNNPEIRVSERFRWLRLDPAASASFEAMIRGQARCPEARTATLLPVDCFPDRELRLGDRLRFFWER